MKMTLIYNWGRIEFSVLISESSSVALRGGRELWPVAKEMGIEGDAGLSFYLPI